MLNFLHEIRNGAIYYALMTGLPKLLNSPQQIAETDKDQRKTND